VQHAKREGDSSCWDRNNLEREAGCRLRRAAASALAFEAYAGFISVSRHDALITVSAEVPPPIVEMPEGIAYAGEANPAP
jgi:hypothetical protein